MDASSDAIGGWMAVNGSYVAWRETIADLAKLVPEKVMRLWTTRKPKVWHINAWEELGLAVQMTMVAKVARGHRIQIMCDNKTACYWGRAKASAPWPWTIVANYMDMVQVASVTRVQILWVSTTINGAADDISRFLDRDRIFIGGQPVKVERSPLCRRLVKMCVFFFLLSLLDVRPSYGPVRGTVGRAV